MTTLIVPFVALVALGTVALVCTALHAVNRSNMLVKNSVLEIRVHTRLIVYSPLQSTFREKRSRVSFKTDDSMIERSYVLVRTIVPGFTSFKVSSCRVRVDQAGSIIHTLKPLSSSGGGETDPSTRPAR